MSTTEQQNIEKRWQSISPNTLLPIGTPVSVGHKHGKVIKAEIVESSNRAGLICVHTIKFTVRLEVTNLCTRQKRINPAKVETVNYSFIKAYLP